MAVKWLQSAHYPREQPKLQPGLERAELDRDFERGERARRPIPGLERAEIDASYQRLLRNLETPYGQAQTRLRR